MPRAPRKPALPRMSEDTIQKTLARHLRLRARHGVVWFHCPNGGARSARTGALLKAMGVLPGVADMIYLLPGARVVFHELKATDGEIEPSQAQFAADVRRLGFEHFVSFGLDDALAVAERVGVLG